jgi:hypothetical protein
MENTVIERECSSLPVSINIEDGLEAASRKRAAKVVAAQPIDLTGRYDGLESRE